MGSPTAAVRPESTGSPVSSRGQAVGTDRLDRPTRVAVIDRRTTLRADLARAIVEDPDLEMALSSDCLQDALALLIPLDLILLGDCRGRGGSTCDLAMRVTTSSETAVVVIGPDPVPGVGSGPRASAASGSDHRPASGTAAGSAPGTTAGSCSARLGAPQGALAAEACTDEEAVRHAIHAATASPPPRHQSPQPAAESRPARPSLSTQEARALALYSSGLTLDAVADAMYVTPNTAATYLRRVRAKFRATGSTVDSKLELRDLAVAHGLLEG